MPAPENDMTNNAEGARIDRLCEDLENRIRSGEMLQCEAYFEEYRSLFTDPNSAIDLIFTEYMARIEVGDRPSVDEYLQRFPQFKTQLEQQFQLAELLDEPVVSCLEPPTGELGSTAPVSRFRIVQLLARGGIGQVMRAIDTELNREVAVKEIQPNLVAFQGIQERFVREAEITGRLEHPGIVPVYGFGKNIRGQLFYAMRLVRGQSFYEAIREFHARSKSNRCFRSLDFQKLLRRFLSVCDTIAYAHSHGIIHRDIKPQNILLGPFGETLVVDWGLAKKSHQGESNPHEISNDVSHGQALEVSSSNSPEWSVDLTHSKGALIGTPAFMSPEQARGDMRNTGPASDVYSLGATLHSLLSGRNRFGDSDVNDTLQKVIQGDFPRPREINRSIPRSLEAICMRAMELLPGDRYASASALASDIEHYLADEPVSAVRESIVNRLGRSGRRNRNVVVGGFVALVLLTTMTIVAAVRINSERLRADQERIEASRRNARLAFDRGYQLIEQHQSGEGVMWLERALQHAPPTDAVFRQVILTNLSAARNQLLHRRAMFEHDRLVLKVAFSPDGKYFLSVDSAGSLKVWDVEIASILNQRNLRAANVLALGFTDSESVLMATLSAKSISIQRLSLLESTEPIPIAVLENVANVDSVVFSQDAKQLAISTRANGGGTVGIWRALEGDRICEIPQASQVVQLEFRPNADNIAIVDSSDMTTLWDWSATELGPQKKTSFAKTKKIAFSPQGRHLFAGGVGGSVACWEVDRYRLIQEFGPFTGRVTAVACCSDSQTIAALWDNGVARVWNVQERYPGCEQLRFDRHTTRLAFRPHSRQLLIMARRLSAALWDVPDSDANSVSFRQTGGTAVDFSLDGTLSATASRNGSVQVRDGSTGREIWNSSRHKGSVKRIAFRPDGEVLLTASLDGTARLWNSKNGKAHGETMRHRVHANSQLSVETAAFSPNGKWMATGDSAGWLRLWDADTGTLVRTFGKVNGSVLAICFCPNSESLFAGYSGPDFGVRMWSVSDGELRWEAKHKAHVRSVDISPDGKIAISAGNDDVGRLWHASNGEPIGSELQNRGEVFVARFSPDSKLAVTGGYDATVRLWSTSTGLAYGEPMFHDSIVLDAAFSRNGEQLLTGSTDRTARLWSVATCLPLSPPMRHTESVNSVKFHPKETVAIAGKHWRLPNPLPDDPSTIKRWVRLASQRTFVTGNNIQWIDFATSNEDSIEFEIAVGQSWKEWSK
jgi:eukaryotic-like serine/threonine-protein kinase